MSNRRIRRITVVSGTGVVTYEVGDTVNGLVIAAIKDRGMEFTDSITFSYHCVDESGKLVVVIENCPTVVEYAEVEAV